MSIRIIFSFLTLMFSPFCTASLFPVVTSVKIDPSNTEDIQLIITSQLMDIGSLGDVLLKDYPIVNNNRNFSIATNFQRKYDGTEYYHSDAADTVTDIDENMTLSEAGLYAWNHGLAGNSIIKLGTNHITHERFKALCVGFGFGIVTPGSAQWTVVSYPAGGCLQAPPPYEYCDFLTSAFTIDHNNLLTTAKMAEAIHGLEIECTSTMSVRLIIGQDTLQLAPGVTSKLEFNTGGNNGTDYPSGAIFNLKSGANNNINIKSTLSISPDADAGSYEASTVVYIEYP